MPTYVAFLRAINLGARRKVPMADLREALAGAGFTEVATHIQTGNVRVRTPLRSAAAVESRLETLLADRYGFDVPAIVFTPAALRRVHDDALAFDPPGVAGEHRYVVLFKRGETPDRAAAAALAAWDAPGEAAALVGRAVHLWIDGGTQGARVLAAHQAALAPGTNRNLRVLGAVTEKWASGA